MATQNRTTLKSYFNIGDRPTEDNFSDLVDSSLNITDDKASDTEAENDTIDSKYLTPKTGRKTVEKFAPVKKVNGKSPNTSGEISVTTADIPSLDTALAAKQATLVSGTNIRTVHGNSLLGTTDISLVTVVKLASDSAKTTKANVTDMLLPVTTGKKYFIHIIGEYQTGNIAIGGDIGFVLTSGSGTIKGTAEIQSGSGSVKKVINSITSTNTNVNSYVASTSVTAINTPQFLEAKLYLECNSSGNFQLQWGGKTADSSITSPQATLKNGTVILVTSW